MSTVAQRERVGVAADRCGAARRDAPRAAEAPRRRRRLDRRRSRALLAGVVAVNVAVLRSTSQLDGLEPASAAQLKADIAGLRAGLSSAACEPRGSSGPRAASSGSSQADPD